MNDGGVGSRLNAACVTSNRDSHAPQNRDQCRVKPRAHRSRVTTTAALSSFFWLLDLIVATPNIPIPAIFLYEAIRLAVADSDISVRPQTK